MSFLGRLRNHQGNKSKAQSDQVHRMTERGQRVLLCDICRRYVDRNPHMVRQQGEEEITRMLELVEINPGDGVYQHMTNPGRLLHFAAVEDRPGDVSLEELESLEKWKKSKL